ncbi:MAG: hypothetical protein ACPGFB_07950 [Verrucomicrobiales bacterium]
MKPILTLLVSLFCWHAAADETKVIVHLLDHTDAKNTEQRFWIDWNEKWRGIVASETVTGEKAGELIEMFQRSLEETEALHFCGHDPIYGIEATTADSKVLKTSLCFTCVTWVKPGLRLNLAGERGADNELCRALRTVIELPHELPGDSKTK